MMQNVNKNIYLIINIINLIIFTRPLSLKIPKLFLSNENIRRMWAQYRVHRKWNLTIPIKTNFGMLFLDSESVIVNTLAK